MDVSFKLKSMKQPPARWSASSADASVSGASSRAAASGLPAKSAAVIRHADSLMRRTSTPVARRCTDRKSTRLNSSHGYISYAVFCFKKKKKKQKECQLVNALH